MKSIRNIKPTASTSLDASTTAKEAKRNKMQWSIMATNQLQHNAQNTSTRSLTSCPEYGIRDLDPPSCCETDQQQQQPSMRRRRSSSRMCATRKGSRRHRQHRADVYKVVTYEDVMGVSGSNKSKISWMRIRSALGFD
mmetsp:Transcript_20998/g.32035  ORF Transcript_20998/g.32035 Transcript_20998/m.32035 type:complete len:138 (+) Transcript_20998:102-515(+)|eukprot:CAMPEP_0196813592 /NCGR_PEP_ID=MMETSP1362-20130617/37821_1 /TAXON_ID=163516 /ORGANISM="Leptocylindrus danicus, Strain CCMP1856" /LENGTH=137 /DNA_ID=CAMNT_0042189903 /DNA_START=52 /DNA_END=465 /DNA_ORIENTATION=+